MRKILTLLRASLRVPLLVSFILLLYVAFCQLAYGQTKSEKTHVSCIATNHPFDVVDVKTKKSEEVEDWRVSCTISRGDKVLWGPKDLVLPYPEPYEDAMAAINEFRKKGYAEILKQLKKEKGESS